MKLLNILMVTVLVAVATSAEAQENKFRALFIYKFIEYIEWPEKSDKVVVGVIGKSGVYDELSKFAATKSNIEVVNLKPTDQPGQCDFIYAPDEASESLGHFVSQINTQSVLLVCEDRKSMTKGVDIAFYLENNKLRFVIDKKSLEGKSMTASSKLLALGTTI